MSSNIRLKKVCQHCHRPFIAKTTVTKFCGEECAKRNYKKREREKKITEAILKTNTKLVNSNSETEIPIVISSSGSDRFQRELLNIGDLSMLLGITERTLFRAMKKSSFPRVKIGRRLLFNKQQVLDFLTSNSEGL
jgi:predicted DNA-binding transcriptional regulator AlpA